MKVPKKPAFIEEAGFTAGTLAAMEFLSDSGSDMEGSELAHIKQRLADYPHWTKVVQWPTPEAFSAKELWQALKLSRLPQMNTLSLFGDDERIRYTLPGRILEFLHWHEGVQKKFDAVGIDSLFGGVLQESVYSSLLEGSAITERVAKDIVFGESASQGKGARMVLNNLKAMIAILETAHETLTPDVVLDAHRMMTEGTMEDPKDSGRLRDRDDIKVIDNTSGEVLHDPPVATELPQRLQALCDFANGATPDYFIHPTIRAMLVHFQLAYDHPFVDGNGRIARALFYRQMAREGYSYIKRVSISRLLTEAPARYGKAFIHTETDGFDATYFLMHQCNVLRSAITDESARLDKKEKQREQVRVALERARINSQFNHRQVALLEHALRNEGKSYFVERHRRTHGTSRQTASTDMQELVRANILMKVERKGRSGRQYYRVRPNLFKKLGRGMATLGQAIK